MRLFAFRPAREPAPRYAQDGPLDYAWPAEKTRRSAPANHGEVEAAREQVDLARERDALAARIRRLEGMLADPDRCQNAILYFRLRAIWSECHAELEALASRLRAKQAQRFDDAVLPLARRRMINTMLVASAQEWYLAYGDEQVAAMARSAMRKPVEDVNFGLSEECLRLESIARELAARARNGEKTGERLRRRARFLHERLRFDAQQAVPRADSCHSMPRRIVEGEPLWDHFDDIVPVNVLALDYWNLGELLLA